MIQKVLTYLILVVMLVACGKYKHKPLSNPQGCKLCPLASSLVGTYRGQVYIRGLMTGIITNDSATMTLDQVFLNNSTFDDSTTMYFATTYVHDSSATTIIHDTVNIHDLTGTVVNMGKERYWMRNDSIYHQQSFATSPFSYLVLFEGVFLKQ